MRYPLAKPQLGKTERRYLLDAFDSGWVSSKGKYLDLFERKFPRYIGTKYGVATSNGTTALHLALSVLNLKSKDEVIVSDLSFISPANAVTFTGATPVLADSNAEYWGVDADTIKRRITKRTRAVLVVHLYGHPVDMDPIVELCESKGLILLEDCAEAHGARYKGKKVGSFGQISCFSFYGNKLVTSGEGGMCLTDDEVLSEKMRLYRDHGADRARHFWHPVIGFNYRMTNLQAAVGCAQLETLEERIQEYRRIACDYERNLMVPGLTPHPEMKWARCVFWMYTILIRRLTPARRDVLEIQLASLGIETRPIFYPISRLPPYRRAKIRNPVADSLSKHGISLPTYHALRTYDVNAICDTLKKCMKTQFR